MKARIIFYCVVIAVLLATLAAIPSHATERRDPMLNQEALQASGSGRPESPAKPTQGHLHGKKPSPAREAHAQGVKDKTAAKSDQSVNGQTSK
jgi:hypothetical protein